MSADANSEGREWHPKSEFVSDILKENGKTELVGEGRKWNHKTEFVSDILKQNVNTKLISYGYKQYLKTITQTQICEEQTDNLGNCMEAESKYNCTVCMVDAINAFSNSGNACTDMAESGFCDMAYNCWEQSCNLDCGPEVATLAACIVHYAGCDNYEFGDECMESSL